MAAENASARYNEIQRLIHVLVYISVQSMGRGVRLHEAIYTLGEPSVDERKLLPKWYQLKGGE